MRKLIAFIVLSAAFLHLVSAMHMPVESSIETSGEVNDSKHRYYLDQNLVAYPEEVMHKKVDGETVEQPIYNNISVSRFTAMQASDFAVYAVERAIRNKLGAQNMTDIGISTTYHEDHEFAVRVAYREAPDVSDNGPHGDASYMKDPKFSYERLRSVTPENVNVTVGFENRTYNVNVPVVTTRTEPELDVERKEYAVDKKGSNEKKRGEKNKWRLTVERKGSSCWSSNSTKKLSNISYDDSTDEGGYRSVTFTGKIQTSNPCHEISGADIEQNGDIYTVDIKTNSTGGVCVECVGALTYTATFGAEQTYRLNVSHEGSQVQQIDFPGYEPGDPSEEPQGIVDRIVRWVKSLF